MSSQFFLCWEILRKDFNKGVIHVMMANHIGNKMVLFKHKISTVKIHHYCVDFKAEKTSLSIAPQEIF